MKIIQTLSCVLAAIFLNCAPASAQQVTDFNFDNVPLGTTPPTTTPGVDPQPQHIVYAINGDPDSGPYSGMVLVQNVGGLNHAAEMTTTQGGIGSQFIDTQFLASSNAFDLSFDIDVINVPTSGLPQVAGGAADGQAFALQVFGLDTNRVMRFAVSPTSATTGNFGFRQPGVSGDLTTFGTYTEGQTYHLEFKMDFNSQTADVFLNNSLVLAGAPLVSPATGLSELFFFQNDVEGMVNDIALDNIELAAVPEPSTWLAGALVAALLVTFRWRSSRKIAA